MVFGSELREKGQAFSVFRLLIAAIVAIIILAFLLTILGIIPWIGPGGDPVKVASDKIKDLKNKPFTHVRTEAVIWKKGTVMTSEMVSDRSQVGLPKSQICLSKGDYLEEGAGAAATSGFLSEYNNETFGDVIRYTEQATIETALSIVCVPDGTKMADEFSDTGLLSHTGIKSEWVEHCDCTNKPMKCCLIALRSPR